LDWPRLIFVFDIEDDNRKNRKYKNKDIGRRVDSAFDIFVFFFEKLAWKKEEGRLELFRGNLLLGFQLFFN
jgi:glutamate formiminotransferase